MGTAQVIFVVERCGGATGSDVSGSVVSHRNRKYVLRMRNRSHIRPSGAFLTGSDKVT